MGTTKPSLPMTGGCSCGRVRYEITSFPLLLYRCNCTNCQTASGSAFALNMPVATRGFRIVKGTKRLASFVAIGRRGHIVVLQRMCRAHLRFA